MLFAGSSAETDATLRAMKAVATANGAHDFTDPDRVALSAAHTIVFHGDGLLDLDALPAITPAEFADAVTADNRAHSAAFLAVMATVDGSVDAARIDAAVTYVDALGLHESSLRDLGELAADGVYPDWYHPSA